MALDTLVWGEAKWFKVKIVSSAKGPFGLFYFLKPLSVVCLADCL